MRKTVWAGVVVVVVVSGCSAGRHNPQYQTRTAQDSVSRTVGGVAVRDVYITAPVAKGGTARASVFLARLTPGSDELVGAASPVAGAVSILAGGQEVASVSVSGTQSATVALDLAGVTKDLVAAASYPITLTFAQAGEVTLSVPVIRPGILAPGGPTQLPTVVPDVPVGGVQPLHERAEVSASAEE